MKPFGVDWDPKFGSGFTVADMETGNVGSVSSQGALGTVTGREMIYEDQAGRNATLGALQPDEMDFLLKKHF